MAAHPVPATLQAQIDSFAAQRARLLAKTAVFRPQSGEIRQTLSNAAENHRIGRPVRIGEIPLPWWNWD